MRRAFIVPLGVEQRAYRQAFPLRSRRGLPELAAVAASVVVGGLAATAPIPLLIIVLVATSVIVAWSRPSFTVAACLVAISFHRGLFLSLRIEPGGLPVSPTDLVPLLFLIASVSLRSRTRASGPPRALLLACVAMILAGLAIGVILGASRGADPYELVRVVRLEVLILVVLGSVLIAGHTPGWRKAVTMGMMGAAILVAVQLLTTFIFSLVTGRYFWSLFPFGKSFDNLRAAVQAGNITTLKENAISSFIMLPAIALVTVRFSRWDHLLLMLFVTAGVASLSRGLCAGIALTLLVSMACRAASGREGSARLVRILLTVAAVITILVLFSGDIIGQRFGAPIGVRSSDQAAVTFADGYRLAETQAHLHALGESAGSVLFGLGAGVVLSFSAPLPHTSAILENSVLSIWTNIGLLGLLGVTLLFGFAARRAWRFTVARSDPAVAALSAMGLALPILWLQGVVGGTLSVPEAVIPFFSLAGTILATPRQRRAVGQPVDSPRAQGGALKGDGRDR